MIGVSGPTVLAPGGDAKVKIQQMGGGEVAWSRYIE